MDNTDTQVIKGKIQRIIQYKDGHEEVITFPNTVLYAGKMNLALCLANKIGDQFEFFVDRMIFGDGGTEGGSPKIVRADQTGLFGVTRVNRPVISSVPENAGSQVIFTAVIGYNDGNGYALNEMALQLSNGNLYSMSTFPDLNKTSAFQVIWNWSVNFI